MDHKNQNLLNIVIPTKNRPDTLKHSINTILQQNYENFQIIISDNNSSEETREVIKKFDDRRILYFKHKQDISMRDNWEFGLSKIEKGYVTIMGDDDGFCKDSFFKINRAIQKKKYDIINWSTVSYSWPTSESKSFLEIKNYKKNTQIIQSKKKLKNILGMWEIYLEGPMIYNSFLSLDLIRNIKKKQNNFFFLHGIPDISSLFSILLNSKNYFKFNIPIGISGASKNSNGAAIKNKKKNFIDIKNNLSLLGIDKCIVPAYYFGPAYTYDKFIEFYPCFIRHYPLNYYVLASRVIGELKTWDKDNYKKFYKSFCIYLKNKLSKESKFTMFKNILSNLNLRFLDFYDSKNINFEDNECQNVFEASKIIPDIHNSKFINQNKINHVMIKLLKKFGIYSLIYFLKNIITILKVLRDIK